MIIDYFRYSEKHCTLKLFLSSIITSGLCSKLEEKTKGQLAPVRKRSTDLFQTLVNKQMICFVLAIEKSCIVSKSYLAIQQNFTFYVYSKCLAS